MSGRAKQRKLAARFNPGRVMPLGWERLGVLTIDGLPGSAWFAPPGSVDPLMAATLARYAAIAPRGSSLITS